MVDAAILVSATAGRNAQIIIKVAGARSLVTSERAVEESSRRIALGMGRPDLLAFLQDCLRGVEIASTSSLAKRLPDCARSLRNAVPSRNATTTDAHLLALAEMIEADIWSRDRDFAGTGTASWSTYNLLAALAESGDLARA